MASHRIGNILYMRFAAPLVHIIIYHNLIRAEGTQYCAS
jgi:hypothetical protein